MWTLAVANEILLLTLCTMIRFKHVLYDSDSEGAHLAFQVSHKPSPQQWKRLLSTCNINATDLQFSFTSVADKCHKKEHKGQKTFT